MEGGGWKVGGSHKVVGYSRALHFSRQNGPQGGPIALKLSQNIAKSMVCIINQPYGDFKQGGCLLWWFPAGWLPIQADQWHSMDTRALVDIWQASETSLSKSRPVNIWQWCTGNQLVYWWSYPLTVKTVHWHGVRKWRVLAKQVTYSDNCQRWVFTVN